MPVDTLDERAADVGQIPSDLARALCGMCGCQGAGQGGSAHIGLGRFRAMKKLFELLVFFHPLAVVLMWLDLATRPDMARGWKLAWAILGLIPLVPFIYVLTGGDLW